MALPADITKVAVTGTYVDTTGTALTGTVTFLAQARFTDTTSNTAVLPAPIVATLDASGAISVQIPATDDSDTTPVDWQYLVTESFTGYDDFSYYLSAPSATPTIHLPTVSQNSAPVFVRGQTPVTAVQNVGPDDTGNVSLTANDVNAVSLDDPRLTDSRTPLPHADTHALTGSDPISASQIGAATSTDLTNAVNAHVAASDPHTQYLLETDAATTYLSQTAAGSTYLTSAAASSTYATQTALAGKVGTTWLANGFFSAGGVIGTSRTGCLLESVPSWSVSDNLGTTARTFYALFVVGYDANTPSRTFSKVRIFWATAATSGATAVVAGYSGATASSLSQVGANSSGIAVNTATGTQDFTLPTAITVSGTSPVFVGVKIVLGGSPTTFPSAACTPAMPIAALGGCWGASSTSTAAPTSTLDASTTPNPSVVANKVLWLGLL